MTVPANPDKVHADVVVANLRAAAKKAADVREAIAAAAAQLKAQRSPQPGGNVGTEVGAAGAPPQATGG